MVVRPTLAIVALASCRIHFDERLDAAILPDSPPRTITFGERPTSDTHGAMMDTFLTEETPTFNFGGQTYLSVLDSSPTQHTTLIRVDLATLATAAIVTRATLELENIVSADFRTGSIEVLVVTESWVEGTLVGAAGAGATWNEHDTGIAWLTPGGTATQVVGTSAYGATPGPISIELDRGAVQAWIDRPQDNHGLLLRAPLGHCHPMSAQGMPAEQRPQLIVEVVP